MDVGTENPGMDTKLNENSVCDIRNIPSCDFPYAVNVGAVNPVMKPKLNNNSVCVILHNAFCDFVNNVDVAVENPVMRKKLNAKFCIWYQKIYHFATS